LPSDSSRACEQMQQMQTQRQHIRNDMLFTSAQTASSSVPAAFNSAPAASSLGLGAVSVVTPTAQQFPLASSTPFVPVTGQQTHQSGDGAHASAVLPAGHGNTSSHQSSHQAGNGAPAPAVTPAGQGGTPLTPLPAAPAVLSGSKAPGDDDDSANSNKKRDKADNIELGPMPQPHELRVWKTRLYDKVSNAYFYDSDKAFEWIVKVSQVDSIDDLEDNPFPALEAKLSTAIMKSISRDTVFNQKIDRYIEEYHGRGKRLRSRQIIWLMYDYLKPRELGESIVILWQLSLAPTPSHVPFNS
jgi:hypothetical protein